jgi:hypothetical protein
MVDKAIKDRDGRTKKCGTAESFLYYLHKDDQKRFNDLYRKLNQANSPYEKKEKQWKN